MRSKTLFVWLATALTALIVTLLPQTAQAQINATEPATIICYEDTLGPVPINGIIDELGDGLIVTVRAAFSARYCDSVAVGLDPTDPTNSGLPDLGSILGSAPQVSLICPSGPGPFIYRMDWVVTDHMGLAGVPIPSGQWGTSFDSCLVVATLDFHPEGTDYPVGTELFFGITWLGWDNAPLPNGTTVCADNPYNWITTCELQSGCAYIGFREVGGFMGDNLVAIGDRVYLDADIALTIDELAGGDTLVWDAGALDGTGSVNWKGSADTITVAPGTMENEFGGCRADTIFLVYFTWDAAGGEVWPDDAVAVDTVYCKRPVDNLPPELDILCVDSCEIVQMNYLDNDTIAGCGDFLRIWMSTTEEAQGKFPTNCDGDPLDMTYSYEPDRVDCDQTVPNFDAQWMAVDLSELVPSGYLFPMNEDSVDLLSLDEVWVSGRFGSLPDPGEDNDLMYIDIPIDSMHWDSIELCLFDEIGGPGDPPNIFVYSIDDAGNPSNAVEWGYEDIANDVEGCDVCLDNIAPELPGNETYWALDTDDPNYCNQRFSPYDSALATVETNISPDSVRWYLDNVEEDYDPSVTLDVLTKVYLIGFDVRVIPDDDDETPTGSPITLLDYYHPTGEPSADSVHWEWRVPDLGIPGSACFTWYGKDGETDSSADFGYLADYCQWGMHVGITEARYMDAGGCNAVLGSDHDHTTNILEGYTQLNNLYVVVDSCFPQTIVDFDLDTLNGPVLPIGPDYPAASVTDPYLWVNGDDDPVFQFRARRFFTQGLIDTCLEENLCYTVRIDSIYTQGLWPFAADSFYIDESNGTSGGSHDRDCYPVDFSFNSTDSRDTISVEWDRSGPGGDPVPDGLYCLRLELQDNAGNVYLEEQVCIWVNGLGPAIDSVNVVNELNACNMNFFAGESLCVYMRTDTSAVKAMFDFSCIRNIETVSPDYDTVWANDPILVSLAPPFKIWRGCIEVQLEMVDTLDVSENDYQIDDYEADCINSGDYGIIRAIAYDSDDNTSEADNTTLTCNNIALLGESRCPRIVGPMEFYFLDPDTLDFVAGSENGPFADFNLFGEMPLWNAFSPGSVDSGGAYDAITNPAHDDVHDSIWVRLLLDTLSITAVDNFDPADATQDWTDDVYHDTLVIEFMNPTIQPGESDHRRRLVRKPLFKTTCDDLGSSASCQDPPDNSVYDGRLENIDDPDYLLDALMEFRYMWNGTWFINPGTDSIMLVPITDQDTVIVKVWTIDGDSALDEDETIFLVCDTTYGSIDVDNNNPNFLEWTLIAPGARDPETHSTATVNNNGWNGDCGYRYAEGDTFSITLRVDEQVHFDEDAYPNSDGSGYGPNGIGDWVETGNWQISLVDSTEGLLMEGAAPGTYVTINLLEVTPDSLPNNEWAYTLVGTITNLPVDTFIYNSCFVVRGAWDQGGNPGRYNEPAFTDAFEFDSFEDTTFCVNLIPCDPWAAGCPNVFGPDSLMGWIAPEDTNITVCATIIETCEINDCVPGEHADSIRVAEGNFQMITDDPNPWLVPDYVDPEWFIFTDMFGNELGWARKYYWYLRADSSDLATIWCDGDTLDFQIRFVTWGGVEAEKNFDECVQVDVNEPIWTDWMLYDSLGVNVDAMEGDFVCVDPEQEMTLVGVVTDWGIDCEDGRGIGVDTTQIWADLSVILQDALMDSVEPDSVVIPNLTSVEVYVGDPVAITDFATSIAEINEPNGGVALDVNVTINDIEHTYDGDLDIYLISPSGTYVELSTNNGSADPDYINTVFDDEAATDITAGSAPFTGSFRPEGNLSDFDGEPINGDWTLLVYDDAGLDEGFINDWTLEILYAPGPITAYAYWTFMPDDQFFCINTIEPEFRFHAAHDLIGHHDRELYLQDTLDFCSDCVPPTIDFSAAYCECDSALFDYFSGNVFLDDHELPYLGPGSLVSFKLLVVDPDHDSSLGLVESQWADLSAFDPSLGWTESFDDIPMMTDGINDSVCYFWGFGECDIDDAFVAQDIPLLVEYNNGDTIFVDIALMDWAGNVDTIAWPIAIYDSLPPIVDFIYTIGDDSIRAYVTPGDSNVHVYADINGYVNDLVSAPENVWADFSRFWCDPVMQDAYDSIPAHEVVHLGGDNYRAYWGWTPSGVYADPNDTLSQSTDTLRIDFDYACHLIGAEGTYDSLWIYVTDAGCNMGSHYNIFEFSGADTTVPDIDSVWVMGVDSCAPGWFNGSGDAAIEVWVWMDSLFNGFEDTLRIDSVLADLTQFGPAYAWTAWTPAPTMFGGAPVYGTEPNMADPVPAYWDTLRDCDGDLRLVAKWIVSDPQTMDCGQIVTVPVKSHRQTGLGGSHGYYMDVEYGSGEAFTATYLSSVAWGDFAIETELPGYGDEGGVDSVLVLQNASYNMDWDSVLTVAVLLDNNCITIPGDTVYDWSGVWIDFTGFLDDPKQYADVIYYNYNDQNIDSLVFIIPLYDDMGAGDLFNEFILSDRYWFGLHLSDTSCGMPEEFCNAADLDSVISFTIQNWNEPNPGMILLCDSTTVAGSDSDFVDQFNMNLWNNEKVSPDSSGSAFVTSPLENLYKVWRNDDGAYWVWYSHEDQNLTRFFVFIEDTVLQSDDIDNDEDGATDEIGEGVDFYTSDLRINDDFPQVGSVDSMNVGGMWVNYLWFADNFSEGRYNVKAFASDIYGHRDSLACEGEYALTFFEDETCPHGNALYFTYGEGDTIVEQCWNGVFVNHSYVDQYTADDSVKIGSNFDSLALWLNDPLILDDGMPGSGVDNDTTTVDSANFNNGLASEIRLYDPLGVLVPFVQVYEPSTGYATNAAPVMLVDPTGVALESHPDGLYHIQVVARDNMENECTYDWYFTLDRTCPSIDEFYVAHPGTIVPQTDLLTSWDYVELRAIIDDELDGVAGVAFDYAFDANRDDIVDAYSYWQTANIWVAGGSAEDGDPEWPFATYWNIRNLTWNSEDTLGLPPVDPENCTNTWFVRVHTWDKFGNYCVDTITVSITDDIAPLAYISSVNGDTTAQGALLPCFEPNVDTDSTIELRAFDFQGEVYDPLPGDTTFAVFSYNDPEADVQIPYSSTVEAEINVTDNFTVQDVNIVIEDLAIDYPFTLRIELESPAATVVTLFDHNYGWYAPGLVGTIFDDEAARPVEAGWSPFDGGYRPMDVLSAFDGENSVGTWTLRIYEEYGYSEGELNSWGLVLTDRFIGGLATYQWFDLAKGMFQYKAFDAPFGEYEPGNTNPDSGWVTIMTPGQDSVTYRQPDTEDFVTQWNIAGIQSGQYNLRFLTADVCDNSDWINTPVVTVRIECDTTAPMALICYPTEDMCVTNLRCDTTVWVPVQSTAPIMSDVDSIAYFFIDSLSVPGLAIHQFIGGTTSPDSVVDGWAFYHSTAWNTDNLLSGWYSLYAVAYDDAGLFDNDPIISRVFVDNTMPAVTECWIGDYNGDLFEPIGTVGEGEYFYLRANAADNIGLDRDCGIYGVQFQFQDRYGNWQDLQDVADWNEAWGADVYVYPYTGLVTYPDANGYYELSIYFNDFGNSPLDSVRFRAYAIDNVSEEGFGDNNMQGDYNRDCNLDRDLECGTEICCMAIEIRDAIPSGTNLWCFNHAWFQWGLPQYSAPTMPIYDGDKYSTCNYQTPIDTLLLVANVHEQVEDEWLMYFKYYRADGTTDTFDVPNDYSMNPTIPRFQTVNGDSAIALESTWDSVYVVWPGARAWLDSADAADGLVFSRWDFVAYVEDLTGNQEYWYNQNSCYIYTFCPPNTPITHATYVTNDPNDPDGRIRVELEEVPWQTEETDTIEVIYNRTTDQGSNDPEALVQFYVDEDAIRNCHGDSVNVFNVELWQLDDEGALQSLCDEGQLVDFDYFDDFMAWDQYPPDGSDGLYELGLYFDNTYPPGNYNFAVVVNWVTPYTPWQYDTLNEGDSDCDRIIEESDSTRIDLVVRIVNVNEPQVVYCYPPYGDVCGAHNTVPLSANDVSDPSYFSGEITQVAFERWNGTAWVPVIDPVTGVNYDTNPNNANVRFEFDERELPGMAGWYYERQSNSEYSWYADRDLFPDVAVYVWENDQFYPMSESSDGFWTTNVSLSTGDPESCYDYSFVIDANDNGLWEGPEIDRWVDDPRNIDWDEQDPIAYDRCDSDQINSVFGGEAAYSTICMCEYVINFDSRAVGDGHHEFRTVVTWYDGTAYHVIENPAPGDSLHVFFVDNEEPVATHDIVAEDFWLNGGRCTDADETEFVTDIQPIDGNYNLVVEDICAVIYQVSMTSNPYADSSWRNVDTVFSNDDMGWTDAWSSFWIAYDPTADNIDNDGDGLVDETYDVMAGDQIGEENTLFLSRSVVTDHCGNTYVTAAESIWVDVSEPRACITLVGDVEPGVDGNDVVVVPDSRDLAIVATNQEYATFDQSILGVFQYRTLNPIGEWTNIQADTLSDDTVRHEGNTITATWDLLAYMEETNNDPEGWYQLRVIAIDTVWNDDLCDNDVCYITIRLNDIQPAARIEILDVTSSLEEVASSCTVDSSLYIHDGDPYCVRVVFAPTNIDTGLASITVQYAEVNGDNVSGWRNVNTIWDPINNGLNGDTTECFMFYPQPEDVGDQEAFWIRAIVEDYNGNDTSDAVILYVDAIPPTGTGVAAGTLPVETACGDRCRFDIEPGSAVVTMTFDPDMLSGEFNENNVWLTAVREDGNYYYEFGDMTRLDDDEWTFDFDGDLCQYWMENRYAYIGEGEGDGQQQIVALDYGCYTFTVHFSDCQGNVDSVIVTTDCNEESTSLVCIDCFPTLPEHTDIQSLTYTGYDCTEGESNTITDEILDGTTEIGGDQSVQICGVLPVYEQDVWYMVLYVESEEAGVTATAVDTTWWDPTFDSHNNPNWCIYWHLADTTDEGVALYPSGRYRVWARAHDAICQIEPLEMLDEFWVDVDHGAPVADVIEVNGEPVAPGDDVWFEINSGDEQPANLWVAWTDGLTPDDSTQTNNIVQVWCKNIWHLNQADAWTQCGYIPSSCNPHYVELWLDGITCGDSLHIVPIVQDRWGNGDLDVERVMEAFDEGHVINVHIFDTTPPASMLWSVGLTEQPWCDDDRDQGVEGLWIIDQQTHTVSVGALGDAHDIWLQAFSMIGDNWPTNPGDIQRMYFEYSTDGGNTWFEIGVDETDEVPCPWDGSEPNPWWDGMDHDIFWSVVWDVSGLAGDVQVRTWAEDECGNLEETETYTVSFDVIAPMAKVFVWDNDTHIDQLETCANWTEEQIPDSLERYSVVTLGACADEVAADAYGAMWFIKRADDHPLEMWSWCNLGDDSTAPFSQDNTYLWSNDCPAPQPGVWYDIAVLTTDQSGNELTWTQFLNYGEGTTWEEKWQSLITQGYVKRFQAVDHNAPMADNLVTTTDCTPDSSVIFLSGNVVLTANVSYQDVVAVTFAFIEQGSAGPWTVIERVEGDAGSFGPVEGTWNTELLNGTYYIGAFAEDDFGNMDGSLAGGVEGAPEHATLMVNVDNEAPVATITSVFLTEDPTQTPVVELERGAEHTFLANASDNFGLRYVEFYYRHTGDPGDWTSFGADDNFPYSVNWVVPTNLVVGWTYEFAVIGWDYCNQTEIVFSWSGTVVDEEANISIYAINDFYDVEGTPHVHGTNLCIYAESEPYLDYVRFIYVTAEGDTHEITTVQGNVGQTDWSSCPGYWDVTTLPEGPGQICAIGSADLGGDLVTRATDCRNIIIDHSLPYDLTENGPASHGLIGGYCALEQSPIATWNEPDDIWVHFNNQQTDAGLDTVWFEWKWAESPDDEGFWYPGGYAYQDNGVSGNWVYSWDVYTYFTSEWDACGTISLRAALSDNAIPESNIAYVLFADTVRVDNCPPDVMFTNVNGDMTPSETVIPWGDVINMVATAEDVFGQGGNSNIAQVCFYGEEDTSPDLISCDSQGPLWSAQLATTALTPNSWYTLVVVAWDEAGNCSEHTIQVYIEDSQYQRACIVGYDDDNEFGCDDYPYAVTDDCDPNWTSQVQFQVSTNQGQTWIPLQDAINTRVDQCNEWLAWHLWQVTLEFNEYPANAWFRAVAWDETGNIDPNPPVWRRTDVTVTEEVQIYAPDWVRVPSNGEEQPWVLATLEDYTENCLINAGVVCIEPEAGSSYYGGELPSNTLPCQLEDEDGRVTIFTSNKVTQGDNTFIEIVTYAMDIHEANYQGGSNGTLVSEDGVLEVTVPAWGTGWRGSMWFQPYLPEQSHSLVPAYQYYYTLISTVEEIQSDDLEELDIVQPASSFRMHFDNSLLPENAEEWQVVVAYWNWDASDASGQYEGMWQEWGITYNDRDLENGTVDFQWTPDWDISDLTSVCPDRARFGVFITTIRPIDEFVRVDNGDDCSVYYEDLPNYNGMPVVDCTPQWWVVLGEGEYPPTPDRVDVWLDGIRIVNDGVPVEMEDYDGYEDCYYDELRCPL
ncbi:MAG: proprotein convertase P-domain-containing protein [bacterium]|nr:proprotein convertase P-domain-containing protein [bacterium]